MTTSEQLIDRLRARTREQHEQVEQLTEQWGALTSRRSFSTHLWILAKHHRATDARMGAAPQLRELVRRRAAELEADLALLGGPAVLASPLHGEPYLSPAECYGAAYVIEGSRLGAMVLAKRLKQSNIDVEGLCSVGGDPPVVRARWQAFVHQLNDLPRDVWEETCEAAAACFEALRRDYAAALTARASAEPLSPSA